MTSRHGDDQPGLLRGKAYGAHLTTPRQDRDYEQLAAWGEIRDAAHDAFQQRGHTDSGGAYTIAVGGVVLTVRSIAELAAVTRHERRRWGVRWPEDAR